MQLPPLHPRCRCAIDYREVEKPKPKPLTSPQGNGNVGGADKLLTPEQIKEIRTAEDIAYRKPTGADFGFKKMNRTPDWSHEILMTNPPSKYGHTPNCQRCVVAHEARMRGYDVVVRPSWGFDDTFVNSGEWLSAFKFFHKDLKSFICETDEELVELVRCTIHDFGEGARAIIIFKWDRMKTKQTGGHVIVAQCKERGIVIFGDPQTREIAAASKLMQTNLKEGVAILRVDNLEFTDKVKRCCQNKGE